MDNLPTEPLTSPADDGANPSWFWPLMIAMGVFVIFFAGIFTWTLSSQKPAASIPQVTPSQTQNVAAISGTIEFDGYASPEAYLAVAERRVGKDTDFKDVVSGIVPSSGSIPWSWKDATAGNNYEIRISLKSRGKVIQQSASMIVSSPATNVAIRLVSEQQPLVAQTATISGTIDLKGYVPSGSTVTILAKTLSAVAYGVVASAGATDNAPWSWSGAASGTTYDVKAQIQGSDGAILSNESPVTVTAPSNSQILKATSVATPSSQISGGISGTINLNGTVPSGSYITIGTKKNGTATFNQVLSQIPASNGISWNWGAASSGTTYDVQAYLWENNKPYAQSQILTIAAPSTFEVLTINAQEPISAPALTTFNVSCGTKQGGQFQVNLNYNTQNNLPNPQQYNIVITSGSGGGQVVNSVVTPPTPNQSQTLTTLAVIQPSATYFAQYAFAQCTNCGTFSPLSQPIQFACQ